jgi:mono/diheme cytochrome c family protein
MKKLSILSIFFLLYGISSCSSDSETVDPPNNNNNVTYSGTVKAIIDGSCISCHNDPVNSGAPMPLLTLGQVKEAIENRDLIGRIENGSMPPAGNQDLNAAQIQAIKDWEANNFAD